MEDLKEIRADLADFEDAAIAADHAKGDAAREAAEREARALAADYCGREIYEGNVYDGTGDNDDW